MVTDIVQGVGRREHGHGFHVRHGLNTQAAGNDDHILGTLGNDAVQLLFGLDLVAQEVHPGGTGDVLAQLTGDGQEFVAFRLLGGVKLLEALVAGDNEEVVLARQQACQFFIAL